MLSALEGLNMATPALQPYVVPAAVAILIALFAIQSRGTAAIGHLFGPVMLVWFVAIAVMGISGIVQHPAVFAALNPVYGLSYLFSNGVTGFLVLGAVFLCVTGAEALYADMGHFGRGPIKLAWFAVVFPSLILNYAGQAALVLEGAPTDGNIFYRLCPGILLMPLIVLATVATIIASQSIITGAFSMTRQAIQLGWLPRLRIKQTSSEGYGQIYVGVVNWLLMIVTVGLTHRLRQVRQSGRRLWHRGFADHADDVGAAVHRHARDLGLEHHCRRFGRRLLSADRRRVLSRQSLQDRRGRICAAAPGDLRLRRDVDLAPRCGGGDGPRMHEVADPGAGIHAGTSRPRGIPRVPGTAVFLTRTERDTPPVMVWHVKHNRALHEHLFVLRVEILPVPWVASAQPDDHRGGRAEFLARGSTLRLHGASAYSRNCSLPANRSAARSISTMSPIMSAMRR